MLVVTIQNVKQKGNVADYSWVVYINKTPIVSGSLNKFNRALGWIKLLKKLVNLLEKHELPETEGKIDVK